MTNGHGDFGFRQTRKRVIAMLQRCHQQTWTIQGLGMLRTNFTIDNGTRLHLWSRQFKTPGVSTIHSHPWDFESLIVAGQMTNVIYDEEPYELAPRTHYAAEVRCGEGGGLVGEPELVALHGDQPRFMTEGGSYSQRAEEIHESHFADGTVTLCERTVRDGDGQHARVFWKGNGHFVTAEPRKATVEEVEAACSHALAAWF